MKYVRKETNSFKPNPNVREDQTHSINNTNMQNQISFKEQEGDPGCEEEKGYSPPPDSPSPINSPSPILEQEPSSLMIESPTNINTNKKRVTVIDDPATSVQNMGMDDNEDFKNNDEFISPKRPFKVQPSIPIHGNSEQTVTSQNSFSILMEGVEEEEEDSDWEDSDSDISASTHEMKTRSQAKKMKKRTGNDHSKRKRKQRERHQLETLPETPKRSRDPIEQSTPQSFKSSLPETPIGQQIRINSTQNSEEEKLENTKINSDIKLGSAETETEKDRITVNQGKTQSDYLREIDKKVDNDPPPPASKEVLLEDEKHNDHLHNETITQSILATTSKPPPEPDPEMDQDVGTKDEGSTQSKSFKERDKNTSPNLDPTKKQTEVASNIISSKIKRKECSPMRKEKYKVSSPVKKKQHLSSIVEEETEEKLLEEEEQGESQEEEEDNTTDFSYEQKDEETPSLVSTVFNIISGNTRSKAKQKL